jgi:hypothetical protein
MYNTPEPHRQFVLDLQSWIEHLQTQGHSITLSLDGNEDITSSATEFHPLQYVDQEFTHSPKHDGKLCTLIMTCGLQDVLRIHHPPPLPTTYARGRNRIDYILVSRDILPAVHKSGVLPLYSIFSGDHIPCYIDIDSNMLFGDQTHPLAPLPQRGLQLHDPRKVDAYNNSLLEQLEYHKIFDKLDLFESIIKSKQWNHYWITEWEEVDKIITECMLYAEYSIMR